MKNKFILRDKDNTYFQEFMNKDNVITSKSKKSAKKFDTKEEASEYKRTKLLHDFTVENESNVIKFSEYLRLNEDGEGGGCSGGGSGTGFATAGQNGMGNIVSAQTGSITGSLWQGGSGTIGSGDRAGYDMGDHFGWKGDKFDKKKNKKWKKKGEKKPKYFTKFSDLVKGPK